MQWNVTTTKRYSERMCLVGWHSGDGRDVIIGGCDLVRRRDFGRCWTDITKRKLLANENEKRGLVRDGAIRSFPGVWHQAKTKVRL